MTAMAARRTRARRTADPWRDTDVIDERAPRFNQAFTGLVALLGAVFGYVSEKLAGMLAGAGHGARAKA